MKHLTAPRIERRVHELFATNLWRVFGLALAICVLLSLNYPNSSRTLNKTKNSFKGWIHSNERAAIAIMRLSAKVSVTDARYGGAILINPGGPGGSGVDLALRGGVIMQDIVDSPLESANGTFFYIIGFDPRGINNTTPSSDCFPDSSSLGAWAMQARAQGVPFSNESFSSSWSRHVSLGQRCSWRLGSHDKDVLSIGRYMGTPTVVEDMVAIIEALGEWREKVAHQFSSQADRMPSKEVIHRTKWKRGEEKLLYWGLSYGTLLGSTFAAMHPDKVGRVALDGVVDAEDYYSAEWMANIQDADAIIDSFFNHCYLAGQEKCPLYSPTGVEDMKMTYLNLVETITSNPLPVSACKDFGPDIITYQDVLNVINLAVYTPASPRSGFLRLARILRELSQNNGTEIAMLKRSDIPSVCASPSCTNKPWSSACYDSNYPELELEKGDFPLVYKISKK